MDWALPESHMFELINELPSEIWNGAWGYYSTYSLGLDIGQGLKYECIPDNAGCIQIAISSRLQVLKYRCPSAVNFILEFNKCVGW